MFLAAPLSLIMIMNLLGDFDFITIILKWLRNKTPVDTRVSPETGSQQGEKKEDED